MNAFCSTREPRGLSKVRFHDWYAAYADAAHIPNVARLTEQAEALADLLRTSARGEEQPRDIDLSLSVGEIFAVIVYGQLILEQARLCEVEEDLIDVVFDALVRDLSAQAVELFGSHGATEAQRDWARSAIRSPVVDLDRFERIWQQVAALSGAYTMNSECRVSGS